MNKKTLKGGYNPVDYNNLSTYLDISNLDNNQKYSYAFDNGTLVAALNTYNTSQFGLPVSGGDPNMDKVLELNYGNENKISFKGGNLLLRKIIKSNYIKFNKLCKAKKYGGSTTSDLTQNYMDIIKYPDLTFNKLTLPKSISPSLDNVW